MSQNYNINMKKFNGTDYDSLLPLAYNALNSQQLDGKTFNEIQNLYRQEFSYLERVEIIGTNTYGANNPTIISFSSPCKILFVPYFFYPSNTYAYVNGYSPLIVDSIPLTYMYFSNKTYIKKNNLNTEFTFYSTENSQNQFNYIGSNIFYGLMRNSIGKQILFSITSSTTWEVPYTRSYYIELYGGGGGRWHENQSTRAGAGGSSCQSYTISLTAREKISVTIGQHGTTRYWSAASAGTSTSFGKYSVSGGGAAAERTGGAGAGNLGTNGGTGESAVYNYSKGKLRSELFGYGSSGSGKGGDGAVFLQFLD